MLSNVCLRGKTVRTHTYPTELWKHLIGQREGGLCKGGLCSLVSFFAPLADIILVREADVGMFGLAW